MRPACSLLISLLLASAMLGGCAGSGSLTVDDVRASPPPSVSLYLRDGRLLRLQSYAVFSTDIAGTGREISMEGEFPFAGSVPIAAVQRVESGTSSNVRWIVLGIVAGAAFLAGVLMNSAGNDIIYPTR